MRLLLALALLAALTGCGTSPTVPVVPTDAHNDTPAVTDTALPDVTIDATADVVSPPTDVVADTTVSTDRPIGPAAALYETCSGPGAACEGTSTCMQSLAFIMGPGPRYVCSHSCTVVSDCPDYTPDGGVDCLHTTRGAPQCGVHCNHGDVDCAPYNLNCFATAVPDSGAMLEFCVP